MLIIYHVVFLHTDQHNHGPVIFVAHGAKPGNNSAWILDYTNTTTWEKGTNIKPFSYIIVSQIQVSSHRRASKVSALHVARLGLNDGAQLWISFKLFSKQTFFHNAY